IVTKLTCTEYKSGRRFVGPLPHGMDLITSIENFCKDASIQMARFFVVGAVSSATFGVYDQKQHVYVTIKEEAPFEIVTCTGNVSIVDGKPAVHSHIVLSDTNGKLSGGHLFSDTIIFAGEIDLQELTGKPLVRVYDNSTGLMLWKSNAREK
ncbi:MAG: DNA-binding protein, partial [Desulfobacterales bacterium]